MAAISSRVAKCRAQLADSAGRVNVPLTSKFPTPRKSGDTSIPGSARSMLEVAPRRGASAVGSRCKARHEFSAPRSTARGLPGLRVSRKTARLEAGPDDTAVTTQELTAAEVMKSLYAAINRRDVDGAMQYVDDECVYEDFNFPSPFLGAPAVRKLFEESCSGIPEDLLFVIDDITAGDPLSVGLTWHVELEGQPFPNARGVSFYRVSPASNKLVYARDCVEPPAKLGDVAFSIIRAVAPVVKAQMRQQRERGADASPASPGAAAPRSITPASIALGAAAAAYWYVLLLSPPDALLPGEPAWAIAPATLTEVINESTNFFFILPLLNKAGITFMTAPVCHPASEALFNFAEAWIFMLLPALLLDRQVSRRGDLRAVPFWSAAMFLTNAIMLPYLALRAAPPHAAEEASADEGPPVVATPALAKGFGALGGVVGAVAVGWGLLARPEFGGLPERAAYVGRLLETDRVAIAFTVDLACFALVQALLMRALPGSASAAMAASADGGSPPGQGQAEGIGAAKYVPFVGLVAWLLA